MGDSRWWVGYEAWIAIFGAGGVAALLWTISWAWQRSAKQQPESPSAATVPILPHLFKFNVSTVIAVLISGVLGGLIARWTAPAPKNVDDKIDALDSRIDDAFRRIINDTPRNSSLDDLERRIRSVESEASSLDSRVDDLEDRVNR